MEKVSLNEVWCAAIFRFAIENPELIERYKLRSEYFPNNLGKLFGIIKKYYLDVYGSVQYSKKLLEEAFFTYERTDLRSIYITGDTAGLPPAKINDYNNCLFVLQSLYDATKCETLGNDFIEAKMRDLVVEQSIICKQMDMTSALMIYEKEDMTSDEYVMKVKQLQDELDRKYQLPESGSKTIITDIFNDDRLKVKVDTRKFPALISPLNEYLTGGFRAQATYGFLTKTGSGKSTLLITLAADFLRTGQNVAFVNLEMNDYEVTSNIISALSDVKSYEDVLQNLTNDAFISECHDEVGCYVDNHFAYIGWSSEDKCDMKWLKEQLKKTEEEIAKKTDNPDFKFDIVLIDYLFLMEPSQKMMRNARSDEKYTQLAREVHKVSQEEGYCVITVFQSNRGAESKLNNGGVITLDDSGDSYGANREIEYCFGIQRDMDKNGILINRLKSRHYDGDKTDLVFVPYDRRGRRYDSMNAEFVPVDEYIGSGDEETPKKKKGRQAKYPDGLRIEELLEKYPKFSEYPAGLIYSAFNKCDFVVKTNYKYTKDALTSLCLPVRNKDDVPAYFDYNKAEEEIKKAVEECLAERHGKPKLMIGDESIVKISGNGLFDI